MIDKTSITDMAIAVVDKLIHRGVIPDCTDTDDDLELEIQDTIANSILKEFENTIINQCWDCIFQYWFRDFDIDSRFEGFHSDIPALHEALEEEGIYNCAISNHSDGLYIDLEIDLFRPRGGCTVPLKVGEKWDGRQLTMKQLYEIISGKCLYDIGNSWSSGKSIWPDQEQRKDFFSNHAPYPSNLMIDKNIWFLSSKVFQNRLKIRFPLDYWLPKEKQPKRFYSEE